MTLMMASPFRTSGSTLAVAGATAKLDPEIRRGLSIINAMAWAMAVKDCDMVRRKYNEAVEFMRKHIPPHIDPKSVQEFPPSDAVIWRCNDDSVEARAYAYLRFKQDLYHFMMRRLGYSYNLNELQYDWVRREILSWLSLTQ
jgi:hypothetical protein